MAAVIGVCVCVCVCVYVCGIVHRQCKVRGDVWRKSAVRCVGVCWCVREPC